MKYIFYYYHFPIFRNARVQFIDNIDTFEYPSFEIAMAELGSTGSDNDNDMEDDDDDDPSNASNGDNNNNINGKMNDKQGELNHNNNHIDDVDDDELERLARINANFNTNNLGDNSLKPKGANFVIKSKEILNTHRKIIIELKRI